MDLASTAQCTESAKSTFCSFFRHFLCQTLEDSRFQNSQSCWRSVWLYTRQIMCTWDSRWESINILINKRANYIEHYFGTACRMSFLMLQICVNGETCKYYDYTLIVTVLFRVWLTHCTLWIKEQYYVLLHMAELPVFYNMNVFMPYFEIGHQTWSILRNKLLTVMIFL